MRNRRAIPRRCAAVVVSALISLAGGGISAAATGPVTVHTWPYPPTGPGGSVNTTTTCAGCRVITTWTGFRPGSTISLTLFSDPESLGSVRVNARGFAVARVTIPAETPPGSHTITGTGVGWDDRPETASVTIMVTGREPWSEAADFEPRLPHTGSDLGVPVGIGTAALAVGGLVVFSSRRRKTSDSVER